MPKKAPTCVKNGDMPATLSKRSGDELAPPPLKRQCAFHIPAEEDKEESVHSTPILYSTRALEPIVFDPKDDVEVSDSTPILYRTRAFELILFDPKDDLEVSGSSPGLV